MALGHVCFVGQPQVHVTESLMLRGDEPANSLTAYFRNSHDLSRSLECAGAITRIRDILPMTHDLFQLIPTPSDPFPFGISYVPTFGTSCLIVRLLALLIHHFYMILLCDSVKHSPICLTRPAAASGSKSTNCWN